jgi:hypothetical protein
MRAAELSLLLLSGASAGEIKRNSKQQGLESIKIVQGFPSPSPAASLVLMLAKTGRILQSKTISHYSSCFRRLAGRVVTQL